METGDRGCYATHTKDIAQCPPQTHATPPPPDRLIPEPPILLPGHLLCPRAPIFLQKVPPLMHPPLLKGIDHKSLVQMGETCLRRGYSFVCSFSLYRLLSNIYIFDRTIAYHLWGCVFFLGGMHEHPHLSAHPPCNEINLRETAKSLVPIFFVAHVVVNKRRWSAAQSHRGIWVMEMPVCYAVLFRSAAGSRGSQNHQTDLQMERRGLRAMKDYEDFTHTQWHRMGE